MRREREESGEGERERRYSFNGNDRKITIDGDAWVICTHLTSQLIQQLFFRAAAIKHEIITHSIRIVVVVWVLWLLLRMLLL